MDRATVFEVADECYGDVAEAPELFVDSEEVQKGLGGMLEAAIAAVDDRYWGASGGDSSRRVLWMAKDDGITVAAKGSDGVLQGFTLLRTAVIGVNDDCATAKALHSCIERCRCAGAWLVEYGAQHT